MKNLTFFLILFVLLACSKEKVKPIITLIGEANDTSFIGDVYADRRATVTDNADADVAQNFEVRGDINTLITGTYQLKYTCSDNQKNQADPVYRNILVRHKNTFLQSLYTVVESKLGLTDTTYNITLNANINDVSNRNFTISLNGRNAVNTNAILSGLYYQNITGTQIITVGHTLKGTINDNAKEIRLQYITPIDTVNYKLTK